MIDYKTKLSLVFQIEHVYHLKVSTYNPVELPNTNFNRLKSVSMYQTQETSIHD